MWTSFFFEFYIVFLVVIGAFYSIKWISIAFGSNLPMHDFIDCWIVGLTFSRFCNPLLALVLYFRKPKKYILDPNFWLAIFLWQRCKMSPLD